MLPQLPMAMLKGRLLAVNAVDRTERLAQIRVPMLALVAAQDRLVPRSATAWLRAQAPQLDLLTLQGPHWLLQSRPEACVEALRAFLQRNQGRPEVPHRELPPPGRAWRP
jgi:pimeloyl-ACP methyl ester carboxylesterase